MRSHCSWITTLLLLGAANVLAYPRDHGPFEVREAPKNSCVRKWVCVTEEPSRWMFTPTSKSMRDAIVIKEVPGEKALYRYVLTITNGGRQVFRYVMPDVGPTGWVSEAYSGLINDDKVPDYVFVSGGLGCGIMGSSQIVVFILSSKGSYKAVTLDCWEANPLTDLVDLKGDGQCEFIQTIFIDGTKGKDGRYHNYWVHNLLCFDGTRCLSANQLDHRFPRWVLYTYKPNHADTDQITKRQRVALWRNQDGGQKDDPTFPFKELTNDQKR
jgi:hypothetical protein